MKLITWIISALKLSCGGKLNFLLRWIFLRENLISDFRKKWFEMNFERRRKRSLKVRPEKNHQNIQIYRQIVSQRVSANTYTDVSLHKQYQTWQWQFFMFKRLKKDRFIIYNDFHFFSCSLKSFLFKSIEWNLSFSFFPTIFTFHLAQLT